MLTRSELWLLLAVCVAANDNYDQTKQIDVKGDNIYYDDTSNYVDTGRFKGKIPLNELKMFRLITSMWNGNSDEWRSRNRPKINVIEKSLLNWPHPLNDGYVELKNAEVKKRIPANKTTAKSKVKVKGKPVIRKQPRWKIKKPPGLCLLKVCSSMYYAYE